VPVPLERNGQRGEGKLKAIIYTTIFVGMIFVGVKVLPALISEYELTDGMQEIARFASVNRQSPAEIQSAVVKEAEKDDVSLVPEDVKAESTGHTIQIEADYSVTVDLGVYQWTLNFHPTTSNNAIF
jgi:hypothetical protein